MEFGWTDEQLRLRRGAVEFASARLASGVRERDSSGTFSRELWNACAEFGLQGLLVPAPFGGNIEGVRMAALQYFGKEPGALTAGLNWYRANMPPETLRKFDLGHTGEELARVAVTPETEGPPQKGRVEPGPDVEWAIGAEHPTQGHRDQPRCGDRRGQGWCA